MKRKVRQLARVLAALDAVAEADRGWRPQQVHRASLLAVRS